ncbi:hypothetical protein N0V90_006390 [Kalmusia sp. IMI 367209]|nr:hypothetical protein N0V90_006390 [Kalmusia sp. IMI 367209]
MKILSLFSIAASPIIAICAALAAPINSTAPIAITKVTSSYWRATFSNPPFNVQDTAFYKSFYAVIDEIANDGEVKVVVFDSSNPDFYIAHLDIINGVPDELRDGLWSNLTTLANLPVLTVAAVRGIVRGGGAEFVTAFDVAFGSKEKAVFSQDEVALGTLPGGGGVGLLPRILGRKRALEIILGGDDFDAETAAQYGWINRAISDTEFETFVDKFACRVAGWDKYGIVNAKELIDKRTPWPTIEEQQEDYATAMKAFEDPNVQARIAKAAELGLQTDLGYELNLDSEVLKLVGEGPWNV